MSLGLGAALALCVVSITPHLVRRTLWARALHQELKPIIEPLSSSEILFLSVASGLAEELFFRGSMQPVVGLLVTSLIFGAVHTGPRRALLVWSLWAFVIGLAFGVIFEWTGVLWGPVISHVWINQQNMTYIKRH